MSSWALAAALVAALSLSLTRSNSAPRRPGCDNGKLFVEKDLPGDAAWACPVPSWPESTQSYPGIDTVYDPEPAEQVCMSKAISYHLNIPNSGPYRPVGAESGEYLYCPPERWLNNLHHGATVLLYHPCAPLSERVRLSVLARSFLSDYILTPHPALGHTHVALVSWGQTLELSTVLTSGVCDWLESAAVAAAGTNQDDVAAATRKYSLLLIRPAKRARTDAMRSVRRCCEQSLFITPLDRGGGGGGGGGGRQRREDTKKQEKTETTPDHEPPPSASSQTSQASRTSDSEPGPGPHPPQPGLGGHPDPIVARSTDGGKSTGVVERTDGEDRVDYPYHRMTPQHNSSCHTFFFFFCFLLKPSSSLSSEDKELSKENPW